jgi:HPt (histidine-containing phosphotransfer) domain-containing protein
MGHFEQAQTVHEQVGREEAQSKLHDLLEAMWQQRKSTVLDRLHVLEKAVDELSASPTPASREAGIDAAHKLAGILGTFGLPRGTELAREMEVALGAPGPVDDRQAAHLQDLVGEIAQLIAQRSLPTQRE